MKALALNLAYRNFISQISPLLFLDLINITSPSREGRAKTQYMTAKYTTRL